MDETRLDRLLVGVDGVLGSRRRLLWPVRRRPDVDGGEEQVVVGTTGGNEMVGIARAGYLYVASGSEYVAMAVDLSKAALMDASFFSGLAWGGGGGAGVSVCRFWLLVLTVKPAANTDKRTI